MLDRNGRHRGGNMTRGRHAIAICRGRLINSIGEVGKQHLKVRGAVIGGMGLKQGDNGRDSLNIHQGVEGIFLNSRISNHRRIQQYTVIIRNSQIKTAGMGLREGNNYRDGLNGSIRRLAKLQSGAVIGGSSCRQGNTCNRVWCSRRPVRKQ